VWVHESKLSSLSLRCLSENGTSLLCAWFLSVRNVVPTLTSNKCQGLSLNGRCTTTRDTRFILVPAVGPYVQQWCARGTILLSTGVPVVGRLQARQERRRDLHVPGGVIGMRCCGRIGECVCVLCRVLSPAAGEFTSLL
jgi:hypothetical protein